MELNIKLSDAQRIVGHHVGRHHMSREDMEIFFKRATGADVSVLEDEHTDEETRPLLIEDAVEQLLKKERAERRNLAAYTDASGRSRPQYISVNREGDGKIIVTAREWGHVRGVNMEVPFADLAKFAEDLYRSTRQ